MADNVFEMKKRKNDSKDTEEKVGGFLLRNRGVIITCALICCLAVVGCCIAFAVIETSNKKNLAKIDNIEYTLTKDSAALSESDLSTRREEALKELTPLLSKGGIVGVRANMLAADVMMQKKNYESARTYWLAAQKDGKKSYTAPICYFNAAACSEELNDNQNAITYYENATKDKDFYLVTEALFNLGRVEETAGDYKKAGEAYKQLIDKYKYDGWTNLAESRFIQLEAEGKISEADFADPTTAAASTESTAKAK